MEDTEEGRVLSIQSSVVYGYVGNKSATFPLQVLGFDVSMINSVQFSNHTGYGHFKGQVLNADDVSCLYEGLKYNNLHHFSHLLTGYIGSKSFLEKVADIIKDLRERNPDLTYVCDPVMGDNGKMVSENGNDDNIMYVPEELLPVYRDVIVPLADIVTPNQFEAEVLTGCTIHTEADALKAMDILHNKGPKTVVISSSNLGDEGTIVSLFSSVKNGSKECYKIVVPNVPGFFSGTGDLFAACLLGWLYKDKNQQDAFEKTLSTVQAVIKRTYNHAIELSGTKKKPTCSQMELSLIQSKSSQMELRLIQSKSDIENPTILFKSVRL